MWMAVFSLKFVNNTSKIVKASCQLKIIKSNYKTWRNFRDLHPPIFYHHLFCSPITQCAKICFCRHCSCVVSGYGVVPCVSFYVMLIYDAPAREKEFPPRHNKAKSHSTRTHPCSHLQTIEGCQWTKCSYRWWRRRSEFLEWTHRNRDSIQTPHRKDLSQCLHHSLLTVKWQFTKLYCNLLPWLNYDQFIL